MMAASVAAAGAQDVQHLSITQPGGMPGSPVVTGVDAGNGWRNNITWDGPSGYYQLFQTESLTDPKWESAWAKPPTCFGRQTVLRDASERDLSRRHYGPPPNYAGAQACAGLPRRPFFNTEIHTLHFGALTNAEFAAKGGQTNESCLPCHTVGYGLPTGFVSLTQTPKLGGVQCENCHGPAAGHAANPDDPTLRPRAEVAATVLRRLPHHARNIRLSRNGSAARTMR